MVGRPPRTEPATQRDEVLLSNSFSRLDGNIGTPQYSSVIIEPEITFINLRG